MARILTGLLALLLIAIVAARFAYSVSTDTGDAPVNEPWSQGEMKLVSWNGQKWTAWVQGQAFQQVPEDTGGWSRHANPSLAYIDWNGEPWQAKLDDDGFLLAPRGDWSGNVERSAAIRYRDWSGNNQLRTVTDIRR